jgi:hypothetical protein
MIDANNLGTFRQIGLTFHVLANIVRAHFDGIRLRESPGLQELLGINYPPENLKTRRRNTQIGWINKVE